MINFKKVKQELNGGLAKMLKNYGFSFQKKDGDIVRNVAGFTDSFYFIFTNYGSRIFVEPWWGMGVTGIVDIYHEITEKEEAYFQYTAVLGNNLGELMAYIDSGNEIRHDVRNQHLIERDEDIGTVMTTISENVRKYLLPYFDLNHSIERIDVLLNSSPADLVVHTLSYPNRAMMGLIAAKLVNRKDYEKLRAIYDENLIDAADEAKREYESLKVLLSKM